MAGSPAATSHRSGAPSDVSRGEPAGATDAASPRGGRPRDEGRDQAILEAAIDLLAQVGYDSMSIESVAGRAKVSKATIYRRWPGKAELVADALRRRHEPHMVDPEDTGSLRGDLLAMVLLMFDNMSGIDGGLLCGLATAVRADAELGKALSAQKQDYRERVVGMIVSRAQARGELPADVEPGPVFEVAPAVALFHQMSGEPLDRPYAEHLVDNVLIPVLRP